MVNLFWKDSAQPLQSPRMYMTCMLNELYLMLSFHAACHPFVVRVSFQDDSRFTTHERNKIIKGKKYLFILRSLRKEGFTHAELDHLFESCNP